MYSLLHLPLSFALFFFNDPATTEIYTLSLHDALPISPAATMGRGRKRQDENTPRLKMTCHRPDRKSTRLNSSHRCISYAVFCLKKKKKTQYQNPRNYVLRLHLNYTQRMTP